MPLDRHVRRPIHETGVQVDQAGRDGDQEHQRHDRGYDRETESGEAAEGDAEQHGDAQRQHDDQQRPPRAVETDGQDQQERREERKVAQRRRGRFAFEPRLEPRRAHAPHPGQRRARPDLAQRLVQRPVDRGERGVAFARILHVQREDDRQEVVADEPLVAEEASAGDERRQRAAVAGRRAGGRRRLARAPARPHPIPDGQDRVGGHPRDAVERRLDRAHAACRLVRERPRRLDERQRHCAFRKHLVEVAGGRHRGIGIDDHAADGVVPRDLQSEVDSTRDQGRVDRDDPPAKPHDLCEDGGEAGEAGGVGHAGHDKRSGGKSCSILGARGVRGWRPPSAWPQPADWSRRSRMSLRRAG